MIVGVEFELLYKEHLIEQVFLDCYHKKSYMINYW